MTPIEPENIVHVGDMIKANVPNGLYGRAVGINSGLIEVLWSDGQRLHHHRTDVVRLPELGALFAHAASPKTWGYAEAYSPDGRVSIRTPDGRLRQSAFAAWRPVRPCTDCGGMRERSRCSTCCSRGWLPAVATPVREAFPAWSRPEPVGAFAIGQVVKHCDRPGRWRGKVVALDLVELTIQIDDDRQMTKPLGEWVADGSAPAQKPRRRYVVGDVVRSTAGNPGAYRVVAIRRSVRSPDGGQGLSLIKINAKSSSVHQVNNADTYVAAILCTACAGKGCGECDNQGYVAAQQPPPVNTLVRESDGRISVVRESTITALTVQDLGTGESRSLGVAGGSESWAAISGDLCPSCHGIDAAGCDHCDGLGWIPAEVTHTRMGTSPVGSSHYEVYPDLLERPMLVSYQGRRYLSAIWPSEQEADSNPRPIGDHARSPELSPTVWDFEVWSQAQVCPNYELCHACTGEGCPTCMGLGATNKGGVKWALTHIDVWDPDLVPGSVLTHRNYAEQLQRGIVRSPQYRVERRPGATFAEPVAVLEVVNLDNNQKRSMHPSELADYRHTGVLPLAPAARAQAIAQASPVVARRTETAAPVPPPPGPPGLESKPPPATDAPAFDDSDAAFARRRRRRRQPDVEAPEPIPKVNGYTPIPVPE